MALSAGTDRIALFGSANPKHDEFAASVWWQPPPFRTYPAEY